MKRWALLLFLLLPLIVAAQIVPPNTTNCNQAANMQPVPLTPHVSLYIPPPGTGNWAPYLNCNFDIIDYLASGNLQMPAINVSGTATFNDVVINGTCTGSGCGGGGGGGIQSINADTTSAQIIAGTPPITVSTGSGTTVIDCPGCGSGSVDPGAQYSIPYYNDALVDTSIGPAPGVTVDSTGTILQATGGFATGTSPPACTGPTGFGGGICAGLNAVHVTPAAGVGILQADLTNNVWLQVLGTGSYAPVPKSASAPLVLSALGNLTINLGTAIAPGAVQCDGTTITCTGGVITAVTGGSGTVTQVNPATGAGTIAGFGTFGFSTQNTTPTLTIAMSNAAANTVFGNFTGSSAPPSSNVVSACGDSGHALSWVAGTGFACQAITGSGIASINANTTAAQVIQGTSPITVNSSGGTTTIDCPTCGTGTGNTTSSGMVNNNLAKSTGANSLGDSGIAVANVPTMASNASGSGNIITSAGANKTQQDSGIVATSLAPKASPTFTGTVTMPAPTFNDVTGATQCLSADTAGVVTGTGVPCSSGGIGFNGTPTTTALVTDFDSTHVQTPSATSTLDSSGNMSLAGTFTSGVGSTDAGVMGVKQGSTNICALTANTVGVCAPSSVQAAGWNLRFPGTENASAGILHVGAAASNVSIMTVSALSLTADVSGTLPVANGGTGTASTLTGLMRGSASAMTAAEISGDCTTSGSNAITCTKTSGVSFATSATTDTTNGSNISSGTVALARLPSTVKTRSFGTTFGDTTGSALTAGPVVYFTVPYACTISAWNITVDAGTVTFDIWKIATGTAIPTVSNTITASAKPALASNTALHSTSMSGWTLSVTANDIFGIKLDTVATAKYAELDIQCDQ